jgi:hypothetical protein
VYDAFGNPAVLCTMTVGANLKWDGTDAYGSFDPSTRQATCGAATGERTLKSRTRDVWFAWRMAK